MQIEEFPFLRNSNILSDKELIVFPSDSSLSGSKRKGRRIAIIFLLQFILNEENNYPFHVITASVIKQISKSSKLLELMNKVGFCCSDDTLSRFLQRVQDIRQAAGPIYLILTRLF